MDKKWKQFFKGTTLDQYKDEVQTRNYQNLKSFSLIGIIMMCFAVLFGQLMRRTITFNTEFLVILAYFVLMYVVLRCTKNHNRHSTVLFYLWMLPLMVMGILMGTFLDPTQPSITIMVFICVLPLFILDKPWRIVLFIVFVAAAYTVCCFIAKTEEMFIADMIDLVLFTALGIGVNCLILRDGIYNVEYAARMKIVSERDSLTKIFNRGSGETKIKALIDRGIGGMFCILDVDDFKSINDQYGHSAGDLVLQIVAGGLQKLFKGENVVMRMGGDEFAAYIIGVTDVDSGRDLMNRLLQSIGMVSFPKIPDFHIAVSLGGTFFNPAIKKDFETLYHESDNALYQAKRNGKGQYILHEG
ncbi:MAG: GGDEF domain-containing protein [Christensenella sp.]|uniref:GGDEF domain-containing protein n=1 Tax=Christensenella sp. TaxID=1935934 RepID=UPI002B217AA0|nr:GGDEF domain-containing protein [Christensenella sp.]MEA5001991.1 GGDEF domain-containing protein [Christensenella sp.]